MTQSEHPDDARWIHRAAGEASASERATLDRHLETCTACRQRSNQYQDLVTALRTQAPARVPLQVLETILERQSALRATQHRPGLRLAGWVAAAVLAAMLFTSGYLSGRHSTTVGEAHRTSLTARAPLPAPPRLTIQPATTELYDLALAPWMRDSLDAPGGDPAAHGDSL